jgi:hypothetical protein
MTMPAGKSAKASAETAPPAENSEVYRWRRGIPRSGGRSVSGGNRVGVVFDEAPEMAAFRRWQNQEFYEVEPRGRCTARRDTVQMWQVQV